MVRRGTDDGQERRFSRPLPKESEAAYERAVERALADEIEFAWSRWSGVPADDRRRDGDPDMRGER